MYARLALKMDYQIIPKVKAKFIILSNHETVQLCLCKLFYLFLASLRIIYLLNSNSMSCIKYCLYYYSHCFNS